MARDPNGIAAAVVLVVAAVAAVFHLTPAPADVRTVADGVAALVALASILAARRVAWSPATVAALTPADIPPGDTLPTTVGGVTFPTGGLFARPANGFDHVDPPPTPPPPPAPARAPGRVY